MVLPPPVCGWRSLTTVLAGACGGGGCCVRLEKALASSEKKHDDLQEEFNRYRRDQRKSPASVLHGEIAQLKVGRLEQGPHGHPPTHLLPVAS